MCVDEEGTTKAVQISVDEMKTERKNGADTNVDVERMGTTIEWTLAKKECEGANFF